MPNRRAQNQKNQKPDEHSDLDFDLQDSALSQESQDIQAEQQKKYECRRKIFSSKCWFHTILGFCSQFQVS